MVLYPSRIPTRRCRVRAKKKRCFCNISVGDLRFNLALTTRRRQARLMTRPRPIASMKRGVQRILPEVHYSWQSEYSSSIIAGNSVPSRRYGYARIISVFTPASFCFSITLFFTFYKRRSKNPHNLYNTYKFPYKFVGIGWYFHLSRVPPRLSFHLSMQGASYISGWADQCFSCVSARLKIKDRDASGWI